MFLGRLENQPLRLIPFIRWFTPLFLAFVGIAVSKSEGTISFVSEIKIIHQPTHP